MGVIVFVVNYRATFTGYFHFNSLIHITPAVTGGFVVSSGNEKCVRVYGIVRPRHCVESAVVSS